MESFFKTLKGERMVSNGMDAPTRNGIECAKVEALINHLNRGERRYEDYDNWY